MECRSCRKVKLPEEFTTLRYIGYEVNGNDLNRFCLRCLGRDVVIPTGCYHSFVGDEVRTKLEAEVSFLDGERQYKGKNEPEEENTLSITFLGGDTITMPVNANTRIKDVKLFIGENRNSDPRFCRLLHGEEEMKVRLENGTANLLSNYPDIREVSAILSYSKYAGQSRIDGVAVDSFGNAQGNAFDLGVDGAFVGLTVAVIQLYSGEGFDFLLPKASLVEKGFTVRLWQSPPDVTELERVLETACQLWVVATNTAALNEKHVSAIERFYQRGKGLYLWGDNYPYYVDVNTILAKLFPNQGVHMEGNDHGTKTLTARPSPEGIGFDSNHVIFTGVEKLYEGITIARVRYPPTTNIKTIAMNSHGSPVTCVLDDGHHRLAIDGGFTRMIPSFWQVTPGTSRFVKNISAWLCGVESDWIED